MKTRHKIDRRQALKLAGASGATVLLPTLAGAASAESPKATPTPAGNYKKLGDLVKPMTRLTDAGRRMRKAFDDNPTGVIRSAQLDNSDWHAFVWMKASGIYRAVLNEEETSKKKSDWNTQWDAFKDGWEECTDGYEVPAEYPGCPRACKKDDKGGFEMLYAGPGPMIDTLDYQNGKVLGEGFLEGAVVEIFKPGEDPELDKPTKRILGVSVAGTFRCSVATFAPASLPAGQYDFYVTNRYEKSRGTYSDRIVRPVGPKPLTVT